MKVQIKNFVLDRDGIEFGVASTRGAHIGDLYVDTVGLVWSKGRTSKENGIRVKWAEFIEWMESEGA